jgi:hypothetical protein
VGQGANGRRGRGYLVETRRLRCSFRVLDNVAVSGSIFIQPQPSFRADSHNQGQSIARAGSARGIALHEPLQLQEGRPMRTVNDGDTQAAARWVQDEVFPEVRLSTSVGQGYARAADFAECHDLLVMAKDEISRPFPPISRAADFVVW